MEGLNEHSVMVLHYESLGNRQRYRPSVVGSGEELLKLADEIIRIQDDLFPDQEPETSAIRQILRMRTAEAKVIGTPLSRRVGNDLRGIYDLVAFPLAAKAGRLMRRRPSGGKDPANGKPGMIQGPGGTGGTGNQSGPKKLP